MNLQRGVSQLLTATGDLISRVAGNGLAVVSKIGSGLSGKRKLRAV